MLASLLPRRTCFIALLLGTLLPIAAPLAHASAPTRIRITGNGTDLGETPILAEAPPGVREGNYRLTDSAGGGAARANVFRIDGTLWIAVVVDRIKASESRELVMEPVRTGRGDATGVRLIDGTDAAVTVEIDHKPFTQYRRDQGPKPIFYPLLGPNGERMTRSFPIEKVDGEDRDHFHQRSFWFTHGNVNGVDFWSSDPLNPPRLLYGAIKETSRPAEFSGLAMGAIETTDDWLGPKGVKFCTDRRLVRFWAVRDSRMIDWEVTIEAGDLPVTFGDTKEGMFGLRVASSMDVKRKLGGKITNAEGITDAEAWGKASPWVDYTGPVADKTVGIAILNHPQSFRYPTTWHVRDYGLFAANPFGWKDFGRKESGEYTIAPKASIHFGYRVILHAGDTQSANVAEQFQAYAKPPGVEWLD
jgi:hypothetical protein